MSKCIFLFFLVCACAGDTGFTKATESTTIDQGFGAISWSPNILLFTDLVPNTVNSLELILISSGDNDLRIDRIDLPETADDVFYMAEEEEDISLTPDQTKNLTVVAELTIEDAFFGELRILSNDADNRDVRIPLCAYPQGYSDEIVCIEDKDEDTADPVFPSTNPPLEESR